ncbi:MAG: GAF domain-containing protein, partial [Minicystis sp.]
ERRVHDEQRFLIKASEELGTSLDLGLTLGDIARLVVPHLADWCTIDLLMDTGLLERQTVAHVDPAKVALAWELWQRVPPKPEDPHGVYNVVRTRRAEMFEDIPDALLVATIPDPEILAICRSLGLRSSMSVPLIVRDRVLGALSLVSTGDGRRYGARDLTFAEEFARRIAIAVDNAQLFGAMKAARTAAEVIAADVIEQSRDVQAALLAMRAERDAAMTRLEASERAREALGGTP